MFMPYSNSIGDSDLTVNVMDKTVQNIGLFAGLHTFNCSESLIEKPLLLSFNAGKEENTKGTKSLSLVHSFLQGANQQMMFRYKSDLVHCYLATTHDSFKQTGD